MLYQISTIFHKTFMLNDYKNPSNMHMHYYIYAYIYLTAPFFSDTSHISYIICVM